MIQTIHFIIKKNKKKSGTIAEPEFLYICTATVTNMKAKIHFLAIPAQEFSKILTAPRHQFLCDLLSFHQWQHRQEYKFITPFENPKEIQDILTREEIPFFSGVQFFEL